MKKISVIYAAFMLIALLNSCKEQDAKPVNLHRKIKVKTECIKQGYLPDYLELSGKVIYHNKSYLTAPVSGYLTQVNVRQADIVKKNQLLFEITTPEAFLMQNADSLINAKYGKTELRATVSGRIMSLNVMNKNVFVDKGSLMCVLMSAKDLKLQVNIPFEYAHYAKIGNTCKIILPDNTEISGQFSKYLPQINEASQTVKVLANIRSKQFLPENMIVKVLLDKSREHNSQILPKKCLQSDALMTKYWLMKLINDSIAVQIPVVIGNQTHDEVEIVSPAFNPGDRFISEGVYGLSDTVLTDIN